MGDRKEPVMKKVLLTGGSGFLGRRILVRLLRDDMTVLTPTRRSCVQFNGMDTFDGQDKRCDLESGSEDMVRIMRGFQPDAVIHSAAYYGGAGLCNTDPIGLFVRNARMTANLIEACAETGSLVRFMSIGDARGYPGHLEGFLSERDWWSGPLHPSVEAYGFTKKIQEVGARALEKANGVAWQVPILAGLYGKHDAFQKDRSHVVAALIKKFSDAKKADTGRGRKRVVHCWGTGKPVRDFLYVEHAAEAIGMLLKSDVRGLINIGTGDGTTIKELANMIKGLVGFDGHIEWDTNEPDGAPHRVLDVKRARNELGWGACNSLARGLAKTVAWYMDHKAEADGRE